MAAAKSPEYVCLWQDPNVEHALTCPTGGLPTLRHNNIRDLTTDLMAEVCNNIGTEPELQPLLLVCGRKAPREVTWCKEIENTYIKKIALCDRSQKPSALISTLAPS